MTIETEIAALTAATTALTSTVNVKLSVLDAKVTSATGSASSATTSANAANTSAGNAAGSAAQALMVYSSAAAASAALTTAQAQSSAAQTAASSASSILSQDLSAVSAALHRSPNAVTAMTLYDTSKDSDGGAWVDRMQHTSWANEPLNGTWLPGGFATELLARGDNLIQNSENLTTGWNQASSGIVTATFNGVVNTLTGSATNIPQYATNVTTTSGLVYAISFDARAADGSTSLNVAMPCSTPITAQAITAVKTRYTITQTATASGSLGFGFRLTNNQSVEISNVKLNQVGALPSTYSASPELVSNGGFDNGTVGWVLDTTDSGIMSILSKSLVITNGTTGSNETSGYQLVPTVAGKAYTISADFIKSTSNTGAIKVGITARSANLGYASTSISGKLSSTFVAVSAFTYVALTTDQYAANVVAIFDNISVKEVTTLATPYVPYSSQTNSFYQSSADGKFYKLGATFNALTEVFRGNKAKFPRLSAVVAEAGSVTIYDLTEVGRPMWMRFRGTGNWNDCILGAPGYVSSIAVVNGALCIGTGPSAYGLIQVSFTKDSSFMWLNAYYGGLDALPLSKRNQAGHTFFPGNGSGLTALGNYNINAVALTILPDAPIDIATGLAVPTIAVATDGGVSVIKQDGTVVNITATDSVNMACTRVRLTGSELSFFNIPHSSHGSNVIPTASVVISGSLFGFFRKRYYFNNLVPGPALLGDSSSVSSQSGHRDMAASIQGVTRIKENLTAPSKSIVSYIAPTFGTGALLGDIRRAYLCNTEVESVSGTELVTNGTFDVDTAGWTFMGTGTMAWVDGRLRLTATVTGTGVPAAVISIPCIPGKTYRLEVVAFGGPQANCTPQAVGTNAGSTAVFGSYIASNGIKASYIGTPTATSIQLGLTLRTNYGGVNAGDYCDFDNVSIREVIPDRSYKAATASIFGTLVKSPVA